VIAPDWRGFGLSERAKSDTYWFPDYFADLDAILDHYSPNAPVNLLGHSMGGNIVSVYAGVRPERVARLINLEGFGLPATKPEQAPGRYASWLDALKHPPSMRAYASLSEVAARLQKTNPRLAGERAAFLARHWAAQNAAGQWEILGDPAHKMPGPLLYQVEEVLACWRRIGAPVLWIEAEHTDMWRWMGPKEQARAEVDRRLAQIARVTPRMMPEAGHMLHHDQPELLAQMIEAFLAAN
jgi:pimeloyl-ACP methyl ester carboxylesterase